MGGGLDAIGGLDRSPEPEPEPAIATDLATLRSHEAPPEAKTAASSRILRCIEQRHAHRNAGLVQLRTLTAELETVNAEIRAERNAELDRRARITGAN